MNTGTAPLDPETSAPTGSPRGTDADARRREMLLRGPIVPTMLRLALPTSVVSIITSQSAAEQAFMRIF